MKRLALLAIASMSMACGLTIGVDAREEVFDAEHSADGVTKLRASDLAVRDSVLASGGADAIRASMATTRWLNESSSSGALRLSLEESGSELSLAVAGASESTTVTGVDLQVADGVALTVEIVSGDFRARDIDGEMYIKSEGFVELENCKGAIILDAPSANVVALDPVDIDASGSVNASLAAGGFITGNSLNLTLDAVTEDLLASTQVAGGGNISLFVPKNTPMTLFMRAKTRIFVELDGYAFDSSDPERPDDGLDIASGITVDIAGGGPQIDVAAETSVLIHEIAN